MNGNLNGQPGRIPADGSNGNGRIIAAASQPHVNHRHIAGILCDEGWTVIDFMDKPRKFLRKILLAAGYGDHTIDEMIQGELFDVRCPAIGHTPSQLLGLIAFSSPPIFQLKSGFGYQWATIWDVMGYEAARSALRNKRKVAVLSVHTQAQASLLYGARFFWIDIKNQDEPWRERIASLRYAEREEMAAVGQGPNWPHVKNGDPDGVLIAALKATCEGSGVNINEGPQLDFIEEVLLPFFTAKSGNGESGVPGISPAHPVIRNPEWPIILGVDTNDGLLKLGAAFSEFLAASDMSLIVSRLDEKARKGGRTDG